MRSNTSINALLYTMAMLCGSTSINAVNTGDLTVYTGTLSTGNCGLTDGPAKAKTHFAAIGAPRWDGAMNCGRCATARCTSDGCPNTPVTVMITDQCPECAKDDLDFSTAAYNEITGNMNPSRLTIEWDFTTCPDEYVSGNGKLYIKEGSSGWWFALQPQNFLEKVTEIKVNDIVLNTPKEDPITSYYFVGQGNGITGEVTITVTSESGKTLTQKSDGIPASGTFFDMKGQFGSTTAQQAPEQATAKQSPVVVPPTTTTASPTTAAPPPSANVLEDTPSVRESSVQANADIVPETTSSPSPSSKPEEETTVDNNNPAASSEEESTESAVINDVPVMLPTTNEEVANDNTNCRRRQLSSKSPSSNL